MKASAYFSKSAPTGPMSYWVRQPPLKATLDGYPTYFVEVDGFLFYFASLHELDACVETLSRKNLPPSMPNGHWLSRLPGWVKSWRYRKIAVKDLQKARRLFVKWGDRLPTFTTEAERDLQKRRRDYLPVSMAQRALGNSNIRQAKKQLAAKRPRRIGF